MSPDWPTSILGPTARRRGTLSPLDPEQIIGDYAIGGGGLGWSTAAAWPANNRALYMPFTLESQATAFKIGLIVGTQSGNLDVGIYDLSSVRLVSSGSTAVAAAGIQIVDIADTALQPGHYYLAMSCSTTGAQFNRAAPIAQSIRVLGMREESLGSVTLPNPATMSNPSSAYMPWVTIFWSATG